MINWAWNISQAEYTWGYKQVRKKGRRSYWGNNSDLIAFDIDHPLKIVWSVKGCSNLWNYLPPSREVDKSGLNQENQHKSQPMPNFRDVWSLQESCHSQMGWETTFEGGKAGGAKLKLKRLNPFMWLINPEQIWIGLWEVVCTVTRNLESQGQAASEDHREMINYSRPACCISLKKPEFMLPESRPNKVAGWPGLSRTSPLYGFHTEMDLSSVQQTPKPCVDHSPSRRSLPYCPLEKIRVSSVAFFYFLFFGHILCSTVLFICQFVYISASKSFQREACVPLICVMSAVSCTWHLGRVQLW